MYVNHFRPSSALLGAIVVLLGGPLGAAVFVQTNLVSGHTGTSRCYRSKPGESMGSLVFLHQSVLGFRPGEKCSNAVQRCRRPPGRTTHCRHTGRTNRAGVQSNDRFRYCWAPSSTFIFSTLSGNIEAWNRSARNNRGNRRAEYGSVFTPAIDDGSHWWK